MDRDIVEHALTLKLRDFCDELGVKDTIYKWNELSRFISDSIDHISDVANLDEAENLQNEVDDLERQLETGEDNFAALKESALEALYHIKGKTEDVLESLESLNDYGEDSAKIKEKAKSLVAELDEQLKYIKSSENRIESTYFDD